MEGKKPHEAMGDAMRAQQDLHPRKSFKSKAGGYNPDGEECCLHYLDQTVAVLARAEDTGGAYGLVLAWCPQGSGPPPHIHTREDEAFLVTEGRINVWVGDDFYDVGPGEYVFMPRGVIHRFEVMAPGVTTIVGIVSPGGQEHMFRLIGTPTTSTELPEPVKGGYPMEKVFDGGRAMGVEFHPEHKGWFERAKKRFGEREPWQKEG